jgi:hypothetical protein
MERKPEWLERKFKKMILRLREMPRTGRRDRRQRNSIQGKGEWGRRLWARWGTARSYRLAKSRKSVGMPGKQKSQGEYGVREKGIRWSEV